jgi:hypothetical protein
MNSERSPTGPTTELQPDEARSRDRGLGSNLAASPTRASAAQQIQGENGRTPRVFGTLLRGGSHNANGGDARRSPRARNRCGSAENRPPRCPGSIHELRV